ncbi:MAG: hypothetical protein K2X81_03325 [Candidatus Obscuribacterales bacterium]|nr:hypothetical protein [Candidatus Obscuribacterales bacterium]
MISGNAEQLIQAVVDRYASCRTYRDSGMAFSRDFVIEFETYYVRPDRFSFRWRSDNFTDEKHIHFEDGKVELFLQDEHVEIPKLEQALAMANGSSLLASSLLGSLLLPELVHTRVDFMPKMSYDMAQSEHDGKKFVSLVSNEPNPDFIQKLSIDIDECSISEWEQLVKAEHADRIYLQMENFLVSQTEEVLVRDSEIGTRVMFKHVAFDQ